MTRAQSRRRPIAAQRLYLAGDAGTKRKTFVWISYINSAFQPTCVALTARRSSSTLTHEPDHQGEERLVSTNMLPTNARLCLVPLNANIGRLLQMPALGRRTERRVRDADDIHPKACSARSGTLETTVNAYAK